jgi:hypothetical protein
VSSRTHPRHYLSAAAVVAAGILLGGCGGSDGDATVETGTPTLLTPSRSFTAPAGQQGNPEPTAAVTTLPVTTLGKAVTIGDGVGVTVRDLKRLTVEANGPGETSGPAVSVVVEIRNDSGKNIDLGSFAVTASYGDNVPAIPSSADPNDPLSGPLPGGKSTAGTYVFRVAKNGAETITVQVSSNTAADIAVFRS